MTSDRIRVCFIILCIYGLVSVASYIVFLIVQYLLQVISLLIVSYSVDLALYKTYFRHANV